MSTADFTAAASRARGLATHLFSRAELDALLDGDASLVARALARSGRLLAPLSEDAAPAELELAVKLTQQRLLERLARWDGAAPVLEVFAAEQDRRGIRALLRGALQGAPAQQRLAGLLPTRTLPTRLLETLARQPTPAAVVSHLFATKHPDAPRLLPLTTRKAQPELFAIELALLQGFAERTARALEQGADEALRTFVAHRLDLANAQSALVLSTAPEGDPRRAFVSGGRHLSQDTFVSVASARTSTDARRALERGLAGTPLAPLTRSTADGAGLERRGFVFCLEDARRAAREAPLGSGPILAFLLRLEATGRDLRRLAWAAALHAPKGFVRPALVTP